MSVTRSRLTVASAQYPLDPVPDFAAWAAKMTRWVADGAATGAELLVFPEYGALEIAAAAGRAVAADLQATLAAVADRLDDMDAIHLNLARRYGVTIVAASGPARRASDGAFVNAARVVTPAGRIGRQEKVIMTPFERTWGVVGGGPPAVLATPVGRIGLAICYDSEFPLLVRAMVDAGADLIVVPSCTEWASGFHRVRAAAAARALENQIAVVTSPTVGLAPWSPAVDRNAGAAGIFVPPDRSLSMTGVVAEGAMDEPGWVSGTIDCEALAALRSAGEMRNRADWAMQPGAVDLAAAVVHVDLT